MEPQAKGPAQAQVQQPAHPIHEENAAHEALTKWVSENPDNDPHAGTDLEEPKKEEAKAEPEAKEESKEEAKAEEEDGGIQIDEETPFFELEYNGKKEKLSAKQLREGYLAKQDYHRNIQKVKQEQATLEEQKKAASLQAQQDYLQKLEVHKQAVQKLASVKSLPEIEALSKTDPAAAQQEFLRMISVNQVMQQIEAEQHQVRTKLQNDHRSAVEKAIRQARETLENDIPGWNEEKYKQVLNSVSKDYGIEGKDLSQVYDARLIKVFHDAYQYRQLQRAKPEISRKVVAVPKVVKPGSADKPNTSTEVQELQDRLKKTGRGEDFVALQLAKQKLQKRK